MKNHLEKMRIKRDACRISLFGVGKEELFSFSEFIIWRK